MTKELADKIFYFIKKKKSIEDICQQLEITKETLIGIVMLMKEQGYMCDYINGVLVVLKKPIKDDDVYQIPLTDEHIELCLISDTHLCSKYDRLDILNYIYEKAEKRGIRHILHSGDFTDGKSNRPEHLYELKEISYEGQVDYCVDKFPRSSTIKTYVIQGNHDNWWYKSTGSEIVKSIAQRRDDLIYLGSDYADLRIGKLKIRLFHGIGGNAYARSYKLQKYLDSIPQDERPHILQTGHIHQSFYMKQDDTHCFQTSCLEDQTPYARSLGLANDKSCWWVSIDMEKGRIIRINQELENFGKKLKR